MGELSNRPIPDPHHPNPKPGGGGFEKFPFTFQSAGWMSTKMSFGHISEHIGCLWSDAINKRTAWGAMGGRNWGTRFAGLYLDTTFFKFTRPDKPEEGHFSSSGNTVLKSGTEPRENGTRNKANDKDKKKSKKIDGKDGKEEDDNSKKKTFVFNSSLH